MGNADRRTKPAVQLRTDGGEKPDQPANHAVEQTSVAVRGTDTAVIATLKIIRDPLVYPRTVTYMLRILNTIGCVMTSRRADIRSHLHRAWYEAEKFRSHHRCCEMPVHLLCQRMADISQVHPPRADMSLGCNTMFIQWDCKKGALLYKINRARRYSSCRVASGGAKHLEAMSYFDKHFENEQCYNHDEVIQLAISCLSSIYSRDLKANEFHIGVVSASEPEFRELTEKEVRGYLARIAKRGSSSKQ